MAALAALKLNFEAVPSNRSPKRAVSKRIRHTLPFNQLDPGGITGWSILVEVRPTFDGPMVKQYTAVAVVNGDPAGTDAMFDWVLNTQDLTNLSGVKDFSFGDIWAFTIYYDSGTNLEELANGTFRGSHCVTVD